MAQDYVDLASNIMLHPLSKLTSASSIAVSESDDSQTSTPVGDSTNTASIQTFAVVYPLHHLSALGFIKSPIRCPMVIERWSPYEIAVFEASLAEYGKDFFRVQKEIGGSKSTAEIVEFYYIWKKTSHYAKWKKEYIPEYLDVSEDEGSSGKPNAKR
jgi:hypothetical protein